MTVMNKQSGAFLTISELASELDIPQHILRYWETRFPALKPLQRAGNRRYYRTDDVALARRIHHLLTVEGYTVRGAQKALATDGRSEHMVAPPPKTPPTVPPPSATFARPDEGEALARSKDQLIGKLKDIRALLEAAL